MRKRKSCSNDQGKKRKKKLTYQEILKPIISEKPQEDWIQIQETQQEENWLLIF